MTWKNVEIELKKPGMWLHDNNPWLLRTTEEGIGFRERVIPKQVIAALLRRNLLQETQPHCYELIEKEKRHVPL